MYTKNVTLSLICALMSSVSATLLGQQPHNFIETRFSPDCAGLASCAIVNCPDLPGCTGERVGDVWRYCERRGCHQFFPDPIGQTTTICEYNCTDTPLPFAYDALKAAEQLFPTLAPMASALCAMAPPITHALYRKKYLPLRYVCGWGCAGFLWGLNCVLAIDGTQNEKMIYAAGVPLVVAAVTEYVLHKEGR